MKPTGNIYDELAEISAVLASLDRINPYKVPDNYFTEVADEILSQSISEAYIESDRISAPGMEVPAGYFDDLAGNILAKIKSGEPALSPFWDCLDNKNVFRVPEDYFELLPGEILATIATNNLQAKAGKENIFSVPDGYFHHFSEGVVADFKAAELRKMTGESMPFSIPSGYFENLSAEILQKVKLKQEPAKVITMKPRVFSIPKMAVAAAITAVMAISAWFMFNNAENNNIDKSTLAEAKEIIQTNSFEQVLNSLTDEEITGYLEVRGQDVKAALVGAAAANDTDLPAAEDYIFDENTLNEFLKEKASVN